MRRLLLALLTLMLATGAAAAETRGFGRGSWQQLVEAHRGQPMVVHFWSLSCAPCLVELPRWQALRASHPGMALVLVSTDPLDQAAKLQRTLARAGLAREESWAFADPFAERLRFEVDRHWRGELPMTRLIGADGSAETVTGTVESAALAGWLTRQEGGKDGHR
jgi:thiol-disulfide isomerase/thioredoxin